MQKQRKAKLAKRSSFQEGHIQIGYAIDLSKGKHADELKVKNHKNTKAPRMGSMQHISRSGEKGGPSAQQMGESRMLYVNQWE